MLFLVITIGYADTMILFLLGAREVLSSDEKSFFEAASQEAYKLSVPMPRLYFYNGSLERAFVLQSRDQVSIIMNKNLLRNSLPGELSAICFELLLQVKKGMAPKRTRTMFILGFITWIFHSVFGLLLTIFPFREVRRSIDWFLSYLIHPWLELLFRIMVGEGYFKKLEILLREYPAERNQLANVGLKLRKPLDYYSIPSRKIAELSAVNKSRHYQNIVALEFLPHEWDYFFHHGELSRVE